MTEEANWFEVVARCSDEGREWVVAFRAEPYRSIVEATDRAIRRLRNHDIEGGRRDLDSVETGVKALDDPAFLHVVHRFYYGVWAYYFYMTGDLDRAEEYMGLAHDAVRFAMSDGRLFLLPMVDQCIDFRQQRTRIARARGDWDEMGRQVTAIRRIHQNQQPFCVLRDGTPIMMERLQDYIDGVELNDREKKATQRIWDGALRDEGFHHLTQTLYVLPHMVIAYP